MILFAMLGSLMFISKMLMQVLPNIHLVGMLTVAYTAVFRRKALYPIYVYVFLDGLFHGFDIWWVPYLYIWTLLWGITMLLPKNASRTVRAVLYPAICALHGFLFGILYAPAQAFFFSLTAQETLAWIATGAVFDLTHGISNLLVGFLALPLSELLGRLLHRSRAA